ncbi:site-specific integrase [Vibrio splendidus]|uniref:site-specific integrase n=1 Tax=Vibrio splendidus TaxID=29497 RepID=UPI000D3C63B4|nr:site-specific integrase [Vibrio splendidus]PTP74926.1 hypothetical protein CWO00_14455 [Vibrio splendidus]
MKQMDVIDKSLHQLLSNPEICERIPVLLEKHYGIQMAHIWKFGVNTGLRLIDMLEIELESISNGKALLTKHKQPNGPKQEVVFSPEALEVINSIRKAHSKSKFLFQSYRSRNVTNKKCAPVTRQAVSHAFREVGEILDIRLTPHMMRQIHMIRSMGQFSPSERKFMELYLRLQ